MTKLLDPILGPDGKRLWVTAREHVGAEEVNACTEWTRRARKGLNREHSMGELYGHHHRAFQPVGAVRFLMPRWVGGKIHPGRIYPDSFLFGRTEEEHPGTFQITAGAQGHMTIFMNPQLTSQKYWVQVHGQAQPILGGRRLFRFPPARRFLNSFDLEAHGSPATSAADGTYRTPLLAVIYMERRSA